VIIIAMAAAALAGSPGQVGLDPAQAEVQNAATAFYYEYLHGRPGGLPGPRQRARLRPLLTVRLNVMLVRADEAEARHAWRTHGHAPPLIEGDVFTSMFEGAGSYQIQRCRIAETRAICQVALGYDQPGARPAHWHDQVVLKRTRSGWRVDDVVYGGTWQFGAKGRLTDTLRAAIDAD